MGKTVRRIEHLSTPRVREVDDFVEFIIRKTDDSMVTEGLQQLMSCSHTYDFLDNEPNLYTV